MAWLAENGAGKDARTLLVANELWTVKTDPTLRTFSRRNPVATPQRASGIPWGVPVLAVNPNLAALHLAVQRSRGAALCVLEGATSVEGWAEVTAATDLTGERPAGTPEVDQDWPGTAQRIEAAAAQGDPRAIHDAVATTPSDRRHLLPAGYLALGVDLRTATRLADLVAHLRLGV